MGTLDFFLDVTCKISPRWYRAQSATAVNVAPMITVAEIDFDVLLSLRFSNADPAKYSALVS